MNTEISRLTHPSSKQPGADERSAATAVMTFDDLPHQVVDSIGSHLGRESPVLMRLDASVRAAVHAEPENFPNIAPYAKRQSALVAQIAYYPAAAYLQHDSEKFADLSATFHTLPYVLRKTVMHKAFDVDMLQAPKNDSYVTDAVYHLTKQAAVDALDPCELQLAVRGLYANLGRANFVARSYLLLKLACTKPLMDDRTFLRDLCTKQHVTSAGRSVTPIAHVTPPLIPKLFAAVDAGIHMDLVRRLDTRWLARVAAKLSEPVQRLMIEHAVEKLDRRQSTVAAMRSRDYDDHCFPLVAAAPALSPELRRILWTAIQARWDRDVNEKMPEHLLDAVVRGIRHAARVHDVALPDSLTWRLDKGQTP